MTEYEREKGEVADLLYQEGFRPYAACTEVAKQILSLVEIKADDQSQPSFLTLGDASKLELVDETRKSMLEAGFIRVIPKPLKKGFIKASPNNPENENRDTKIIGYRRVDNPKKEVIRRR